jgi:hypothetical protein
VSASDSGSMFTVAVSSNTAQLVSAPATLTVGPRSPRSGDLRFQLVDSPATANTAVTATAEQTDFLTNTRVAAANGTVTPIQFVVGGQCNPGLPHNCAWSIYLNLLPPGVTGLNAIAQGGQYGNLDSDLASFSTPQTVITSLDLQPDSIDDSYGFTAMQNTAGGAFDLRHEVVPASAISATVAADAAESRVVTAVSFGASGLAHILSYGWQTDSTTLYDTSVTTLVPQNLAATAQQLAGEGYIITAFGGDAINGYVLVGTKVHGDTLPRPFMLGPQALLPSTFDGYAPVGFLGGGGLKAEISMYEK